MTRNVRGTQCRVSFGNLLVVAAAGAAIPLLLGLAPRVASSLANAVTLTDAA